MLELLFVCTDELILFVLGFLSHGLPSRSSLLLKLLLRVLNILFGRTCALLHLNNLGLLFLFLSRLRFLI